MTAPMTPDTLFRSPLIVTASEGHARIDREFFKRMRMFAVRHASSGTEALALARRETLDVIFCDAALGDMDGGTFVAALRADPALVADYNGLKAGFDGRPMDAYRAAKAAFVEQVLADPVSRL